MWYLKGKDSLDNNSKSNHYPTQVASYPFTLGQVALEDQKSDGTPEDDFETADDNIGLVAVPSFELLNMFGSEHV